MSQNATQIQNTGTLSGLALVNQANGALDTIQTNSSGTADPGAIGAYKFWADTTNGLLKIRNAANTAWVTIGTLATIYLGLASLSAKQTFTAQQTPKNGTLTDGATVNWDADSNGQVVSVTTAASRTFAAPTNIVQNAMYVLVLTSGGFSPSWNAAYKWPSGSPPSGLTGVCIFTFIGGASNTLLSNGQQIDVR